jgi:hypothetical protein
MRAGVDEVEVDDHKLFLKTKKKETYLMIIRQNTLRRIKI